jgi:crotonobetainyl-CoA:carnitine CoA-transferase CaiB-like acyl-CoA transferase
MSRAEEGPLAGIRVIEVASWMFVPSAGTVLVDWGADVIKVEPITGDPQRGLITSGLVPGGAGGVNFMIEQPNRGKRSVAIDLSKPDGHEAFMKLVETADVVVTSYLPQVRRKLRIDVDDLRARNPDVIVARGSGQGTKGPDAERGGYDAASFWARGAVGTTMPARPDGWPSGQPAPAFGDVMGGLGLAGAIAAALLKRERTGQPSVVDVSLLATAMWQLSPMVVAAKLFGLTQLPSGDRTAMPNPGVNTYRTGDGRFIMLMLLQADRFWPDLCRCIGRPELATDERFADSAARAANAKDCIATLDEVFASKTLDEWRAALDDFDGVWMPFQTLDELYDDPQVVANGYLPAMTAANGQHVQLVASPAQFDEVPLDVERAPEFGEHTETVLLEAGFDWEQLGAMKESGAIL